MRGARSGRQLATAMLLATLGTAVLGGCAVARSELGLSQGNCYVDLPAATAAVPAGSHLHGVELETVGALDTSPDLERIAHAAGTPRSAVCLVAFTGRFTSEEVADPSGLASGHLAVVVLTYPGHRVLGTLITRHVRVPFGHFRI